MIGGRHRLVDLSHAEPTFVSKLISQYAWARDIETLKKMRRPDAKFSQDRWEFIINDIIQNGSTKEGWIKMGGYYEKLATTDFDYLLDSLPDFNYAYCIQQYFHAKYMGGSYEVVPPRDLFIDGNLYRWYYASPDDKGQLREGSKAFFEQQARQGSAAGPNLYQLMPRNGGRQYFPDSINYLMYQYESNEYWNALYGDPTGERQRNGLTYRSVEWYIRERDFLKGQLQTQRKIWGDIENPKINGVSVWRDIRTAPPINYFLTHFDCYGGYRSYLALSHWFQNWGGETGDLQGPLWYMLYPFANYWPDEWSRNVGGLPYEPDLFEMAVQSLKDDGQDPEIRNPCNAINGGCLPFGDIPGIGKVVDRFYREGGGGNAFWFGHGEWYYDRYRMALRQRGRRADPPDGEPVSSGLYSVKPIGVGMDGKLVIDSIDDTCGYNPHPSDLLADARGVYAETPLYYMGRPGSDGGGSRVPQNPFTRCRAPRWDPFTAYYGRVWWGGFASAYGPGMNNYITSPDDPEGPAIGIETVYTAYPLCPQDSYYSPGGLISVKLRGEVVNNYPTKRGYGGEIPTVEAGIWWGQGVLKLTGTPYEMYTHETVSEPRLGPPAVTEYEFYGDAEPYVAFYVDVCEHYRAARQWIDAGCPCDWTEWKTYKTPEEKAAEEAAAAAAAAAARQPPPPTTNASPNPPPNPNFGDLWTNQRNGKTYRFERQDNRNGTWVQI